jgi:hypothetical protein
MNAENALHSRNRLTEPVFLRRLVNEKWTAYIGIFGG